MHQENSLSLDASDELSPSESKFAEIVARPFVRQSADSLSGLSDEELSAYRRGCFDHFCNSTTAADRDHWLHAMADAIVQQGVNT